MTDATLTINFYDAIGSAYDPRRSKFWVEFNTAEKWVIDSDGGVRMGAGEATVTDAGLVTIPGIPVPSGTSNPTDFQVRVHYDAPARVPSQRNKKRETGTFGWFTITADANLKDLVEQQFVPPTYLSEVTAQLDIYTENAAASATSAAASASSAATSADLAQTLVTSDLGTTDGQTRALIEDPASQTATALSASTDGDAAGGIDDTAALQARINADATKGIPTKLRRNATYLVSDTILVPSNAVIDGRNALIQSKPDTNKPVVSNADPLNGNSGITIKDLRVDGNRANQTVQFSAIFLDKVTHSSFQNLDVQGGLRSAAFPNGAFGDGLTLNDCHYNEVIGGRFHDNDYDGLKMRGATWNRVVSPLCEDNGRCGIQIAYEPTSTTPPYSGGEGDPTRESNHNTFINPIVRHSTSIPHQYAPTTSGFYIHGGSFNTVVGLQAYGFRQGIGFISNCNDNDFIGGLIRIRYTDRAAIDIEGGAPGTLLRNSFHSLTVRGISGTSGKFVRVVSGAALNRFIGCFFAKGDALGTWDVENKGTGTWFADTFFDGSFTDTGSETVKRVLRINGQSTSPIRFEQQATTPPNPAVGGGMVVYTDSSGFLCFREDTGQVTKIKGGTLTLPDTTQGGLYPTLPTPDASRRGMLRWMPGGPGVEDMLYICRKTASDTYLWAPLY